MNQNYFSPPLARKFSNSKPSDNSNIFLSNFPQQSRQPYFTNPKSDYEDRQTLLQKAYNEELKKSYNSHQQQLELQRQTKRNQFRASPEPYKTPTSLSPEVYSPKKSQAWAAESKPAPYPQVPWIEDYSAREKIHTMKKDLWIKSLNEQISEKKKEQEKIQAQKALKEKEDEARVRRELKELELHYKKELVFENGETFEDESIKDVSSIGNAKEGGRKEVRFVSGLKESEKEWKGKEIRYAAGIGEGRFGEWRENKIDQVTSRQKLVDLRNDVSEMIKDLKFEAESSKFEKDEVLRELSLARSLLHSPKPVLSHHQSHRLSRIGKSILSPYSISPLNPN